MDDYAVKFGETECFSLSEKEITAGSGEEFILNPGEAMRIFRCRGEEIKKGEVIL